MEEKGIEYRQCNRCVMDTSDRDITFNDQGYCNHCNEYFKTTQKKTYQGPSTDEDLRRIVTQVKLDGKNREYDCVVGVSGGVDSSYVAYLTKTLGLRALAVHFDNGWNSELSVKNVKNVVKKLGFDYYAYVIDWEEFKDLQIAFLKASVEHIETPTDHGVLAALHNVAAKFNVKYIFSGGNYASEGILPASWEYNAKDTKQLNAIHKKYGSKKLETFPTIGLKKELYYKYIKGIRMVYLLNYFPFDEDESIQVIEKELNWINHGGKHHESIFTKFIQSYYLFEKFGIDRRRAYYSTLICSDQISRDEALAILAEKPYNPSEVEEDKKYLCKKLNMTAEDFERILNLPPKTYRDYPNDENWLKFVYGVYHLLNSSWKRN